MMIKCDKGEVEIKGAIPQLMAETLTINHVVRKKCRELGLLEMFDDLVVNNINEEGK